MNDSHFIVYHYEGHHHWENLAFFLAHGDLPNSRVRLLVVEVKEDGGVLKRIDEFDEGRFEDRVMVVHTPETSKSNYGSWGYGVHMLHELHQLENFDFFIFLDSRCKGPFMPLYGSTLWYDSVGECFTEDEWGAVHLVGSTVSHQPDIHVQSHFWATDYTGLGMLMEENLLSPVLNLSDQEPAVHEIACTKAFINRDWRYRVFQYSSEYDFQVAHGDVQGIGEYFGSSLNPIEVMFMNVERLGDKHVDLDNYSKWVMQTQPGLTASPNVETQPLIYVLYHDEKSGDIADQFVSTHSTWTKGLSLSPPSKFLETSALLQIESKLDEWKDRPMVGLMTYSITIKQTDVPRCSLSQLMLESKGAEWISFYSVVAHNMLKQANNAHPSFTKIWCRLLFLMGFTKEEGVGVKMQQEVKFFPCNCWMTTPSHMKSYIEFAKKAMKLIDEDAQLNEWCNEDARYKGNLGPERLTALFGHPWYTYHPFVMERLPSFYVWWKQIKTYSTNIGTRAFVGYWGSNDL